MKKYVRKSQAVMDFIVDKMYEDGLLVDQVCKKYRDKCPASRNVYKWAARREMAYEEELGSSYDQIDFACKYGMDVLARKRQAIKDRFPKPESK
jgi:hypothetical protein